ncbi:hypothetical protein L4C33_21200 [Vibrio makurazakiensis]|uniref:hypothetical protein n=1 Tax=Vibrio makurazakiensis TaxID=2910250 RepID=UPI003D1302F1
MSTNLKVYKVTCILGLFFISYAESCVAEHCTEQSWSKLLNKQHTVENWYNQNALGFNQLLGHYDQQVLMGEEFNINELSSFWHPNKTELHKRLNDQIQSSTYLAELLSQRVLLINEKIDTVSGLTLAWQEISFHCLKKNRALNYQTSQNNMHSSQSLQSALSLLKSKYDQLSQRYRDEAQAIQASKPKL